MRIGEDPVVDVWMANVSHYVFKIFNEVKGYEQCKFSGERFIILYLRKFGRLLGVDQITPPCLSSRTFDSDCYNLIQNFIWIFLLLLLSYILLIFFP